MSEKIQSVSSANRTLIGFFGRMNAGKSTLINSLTGQTTAIVSAQPGTTTDVVSKAMEIHGIGACTILDTAGLDDTSELGPQRIEAAKKAAMKTDLAAVLFYDEKEDLEKKVVAFFKAHKIPVVGVVSHYDEIDHEKGQERIARLEKELQIPVVPFAQNDKQGGEVRLALIRAIQGHMEKRSPLKGLVKAGDFVVLVMPQDPQAPEGRLIQPEVQTIRDGLDKECIVICVTLDGLKPALENLKKHPDLIVTDSQAFKEVYPLVPEGTRLTSFSILFAALKGDIQYLSKSAAAIETLTPSSKVLIAECCTHAPMDEDIGRIKIPRLLRKKVGQDLSIEVKAGTDFPEDASEYDLIIECGGCMFNRRYILSRIESAEKKNVPMTNYGIALAYLNGILDKVTLPEEDKHE